MEIETKGIKGKLKRKFSFAPDYEEVCPHFGDRQMGCPLLAGLGKVTCE